MSNPSTDPRSSAEEVLALLRNNQGAEALARLEELRQGQPLVLQEALDRYVAGQEPQRLAALKAQASPPQLAALNRLDEARQIPRLPNTEPDANGNTEISSLSATQQHDVYASMVYTRGNEAARAALERGDRVVLGLRQETSSLSAMESAENPHLPKRDDPATEQDESAAGTGVYDDQMVVLWRTPDAGGDLHLVRHANTEPTAQYDHHAGSDGNRYFSEERDKDGNRVKVPERDANPGFGDAGPLRKVEGVDVDGDGVRDAGRLSEGTYEMFGAVHGRDNHEAFRPTPEAVQSGADKIERDTNGDGVFDASDPQRLSDLDRSFKIHRGSSGNTDSAGCQTIRGKAEYNAFLGAMKPEGSAQDRWQYVLTEVRPGSDNVRVIESTVPAARDGASAAPAPEITPEQRAGVFKAYGDIGAALLSHGHGLDDAVRVCAACSAHGSGHGGDVTRFLLSKDGSQVAAVHANGRMTELAVSSALEKSVPEHFAAPSVGLVHDTVAAVEERNLPMSTATQRV